MEYDDSRIQEAALAQYLASQTNMPSVAVGSGQFQVSIKKETELRVNALRRQLEVQERMLKLLEENPVIEQFMNLSRGIL